MNPALIRIATRGSALALAQAEAVAAGCRRHFPGAQVELRVIKTTGDKLQTAALAEAAGDSTKGLFTKELEVALLENEADLAVHSLKDLPTELPEGLVLGGVPEREDPRDVLIWKEAASDHATLPELPDGATVATSSTRRQVQLTLLRPDLHIVPIRGNVGTRLMKIATQDALTATVLAAAGLKRLGYHVDPDGTLAGPDVPAGLRARVLELDEMLPCVGQAALGLEIRRDDEPALRICRLLDHPPTRACVLAERAFLREMGGGCLSPVAAHAVIDSGELRLRAVSFRNGPPERAEVRAPAEQAEEIGRELALQLK